MILAKVLNRANYQYQPILVDVARSTQDPKFLQVRYFDQTFTFPPLAISYLDRTLRAGDFLISIDDEGKATSFPESL